VQQSFCLQAYPRAQNFTKVSVYVVCGCGSVLLWLISNVMLSFCFYTSLCWASSLGCQHDAFAAWARAPAAIDWHLLQASMLSSKPAPRRCCCQSMILTVGLTDTRPFHRPCCKYSAGNADNVQYTCMCVEFFNTFHQRSPWQSLVSTVTLFSLFLASESLYKGCNVPFVWNKLEIDDLMQGKQG